MKRLPLLKSGSTPYYDRGQCAARTLATHTAPTLTLERGAQRVRTGANAQHREHDAEPERVGGAPD